MIEGGARTAQTFGLNRLLGQIYMLLYMSADPLSLDDISDELGISKPSISIACRQLAGLGILHRVWKKGDRKDYYEAETDLGRILDSGLLSKINVSVQSARQQFEECLTTLEEQKGDSQALQHMKIRLAEAQSYCDRLEKLLNNPIVRALL